MQEQKNIRLKSDNLKERITEERERWNVRACYVALQKEQGKEVDISKMRVYATNHEYLDRAEVDVINFLS